MASRALRFERVRYYIPYGTGFVSFTCLRGFLYVHERSIYFVTFVAVVYVLGSDLFVSHHPVGCVRVFIRLLERRLTDIYLSPRHNQQLILSHPELC
jgi:hypothetical protein